MPSKISGVKRASENGAPTESLPLKKAKFSPKLGPMSPGKRVVTDLDPSIMSNEETNAGTLMLEDGTELTGYSFGAMVPMAGEVVFNTGMVGYPEALSDPSYRGQILVLTYPMIGNYGVPGEDEKDEHGLPLHFESNSIHISGLIVADYSRDHSHWNSKSSLGQWLKKHDIPALSGIDTRLLTKKIRTEGALLGKIEFPHQSIAQTDPNLRNLVAEVSTKTVQVYGKGNKPRILAFDCGIKYNIIR
jgi:carbamoyl-phosphate synthase small subunit